MLVSLGSTLVERRGKVIAGHVETYIKVQGQWCTCTAPSTKRAKQSISFSAGTGRERRQIVSPQRHEEHSRAHQDHVDAYAASHRAVRQMKEDGELPRRVKVRSS